MTILPGMETLHWRDDGSDDLTGMITDLIEQANANYLNYLAAAATDNEDRVWSHYHESFALEKDIDILTRVYETSGRAGMRRMTRQ